MTHRFLFLLLLAFGSSCVTIQAQTAAATAPVPDDSVEAGQLLSRIGGLFGVDLPELNVPGTVKLVLRPHFGDFVRRDYARVDTGLRWALNDHFELSSEASVFFTHGFGDSAGYGIGKLSFGSKYIFEVWPHLDYETTIGLNAVIPTGRPPIDMTDGHYHFSPDVVVQHQLDRMPRLTAFAGVGLDIVGASSVPGRWSTNEPHDHSMSVTGGGVYDLGQIKWTFSGTYATTALITREAHHFLYVQPGILWYVPSRFTFHSKTQWIVGLGARTTWGPDGFDFGISSRVRAEITFRQVLDKFRKSPKRTP